MNPHPCQLMESALEPGETLLWTGHRRQRSINSVRFIVRFVFFAALAGVSTIFLFSNLTQDVLHFGTFLWLIAAHVGVFGLCNLLIFDPRTRQGTCYGITERRALIVSGYHRPGIRAVWLGNIESLEIKSNRRGHGSIKCYAPQEPPFGKINNKGIIKLKPLFQGVTDVYVVHDLLEQGVNIQKASRVRSQFDPRLW